MSQTIAAVHTATERGSIRRRLTVAVLGSVALVLTAPFVGVARSWLQATYPGRFATVIYGAVALVAAVPVAFGLSRATGRRWRLCVQLSVAALIAGAYVKWAGSDDPSIRAVELFHFVEYGAIS